MHNVAELRTFLAGKFCACSPVWADTAGAHRGQNIVFCGRTSVDTSRRYGFGVPIFKLVAWPVAQSLSSRFVSPTRVFRATQGHRGSLLFVAFATAGIYKSDLLPKMSKADNAGEAILIALGNALLGVLVIAVTAAIAAAAWRFAVRNDPTLDPASFR